MEEKNVYKYQLKEGRKVIYRGITYDVARRAVEHRRDYPNATLKLVGHRTTLEAAVKWAGLKRRGPEEA